MTTNTTNSQAASIDTREFRLLLADLCEASEFGPDEYAKARAPFVAHIDAKLAQAYLEKQAAESAAEIEAKDRDEWKARAEKAMDDVADHYKRLLKAEAKLAEWEKIVEVSLAQDYATRAIAAESRLAEIQRGVEGLTHYKMWDGNLCETEAGNHPERVYVNLGKVLALLQPQGQASESKQ